MTTWPTPTHPEQTEAQRLYAAAVEHERQFTALVDTDRAAAEEHWQTAKLLQERASHLQAVEVCETLNAWFDEYADSAPQVIRTICL